MPVAIGSSAMDRVHHLHEAALVDPRRRQPLLGDPVPRHLEPLVARRRRPSSCRSACRPSRRTSSRAVPSARFMRDVSAMNGHSAAGVPGRSNTHSRSIRFSLAYSAGPRMQLEQLRDRQRGRHRARCAIVRRSLRSHVADALPQLPACARRRAASRSRSRATASCRCAATTRIRSAAATSARRAPRSPICTTIRIGCASRCARDGERWREMAGTRRSISSRRGCATVRARARQATRSPSIRATRPRTTSASLTLRPARAAHARHAATCTRRRRSISCRTCSRRCRCSATSS